MDTDSSNNYLMENIFTEGHCLSPYTLKRCTVFKQFDGLNFDGLAGKHQKLQNFELYSIKRVHFPASHELSGLNNKINIT